MLENNILLCFFKFYAVSCVIQYKVTEYKIKEKSVKLGHFKAKNNMQLILCLSYRPTFHYICTHISTYCLPYLVQLKFVF
jgi:hypothetical protein